MPARRSAAPAAVLAAAAAALALAGAAGAAAPLNATANATDGCESEPVWANFRKSFSGPILRLERARAARVPENSTVADFLLGTYNSTVFDVSEALVERVAEKNVTLGFAAATKLVEELLDGDATAAKQYGAPNNTDYNLQILEFPQWCGDTKPYLQLAFGVGEINEPTGRR